MLLVLATGPVARPAGRADGTRPGARTGSETKEGPAATVGLADGDAAGPRQLSSTRPGPSEPLAGPTGPTGARRVDLLTDGHSTGVLVRRWLPARVGAAGARRGRPGRGRPHSASNRRIAPPGPRSGARVRRCEPPRQRLTPTGPAKVAWRRVSDPLRIGNKRFRERLSCVHVA